jgi:hypothetical protein
MIIEFQLRSFIECDNDALISETDIINCIFCIQ